MQNGLGAPLAYTVGISLGGLDFFIFTSPNLDMIGICCGLFVCLLTKMTNIVAKATAETLADRD